MMGALRRVAPAVWLLALAGVAALPPAIRTDGAWNMGFLICLYIGLGQAWNILGGFTGQISLGHAAFFGIGAMVARTLWFSGMPFALSFAAGGLAAVLFGLCIGAPTFRLRGAYFSIATLGMAEVLRIFVSQRFPLISSMPGGMIATYDPAARYYLALGLAAASMLTAYALMRSHRILGMFALRDDELAAGTTGVDIFGSKMSALALSSLFAGLCGSLFAFQQISYYPAAPFGAAWSFDALLIAFIGGLGSLPGPLIGAIFYVLVRQQMAANLLDVHQVLFGILFILIVLALPGGLLDAWRPLRIVLGRLGLGRTRSVR